MGLGATLGAECGGLRQEFVDLGERGRSLQPLEDLAGVLQDGRGLGRSGESDEAPTLAEERERLLGDDPEPLPAAGSIGVGIGGGRQVAA